MEAPTVRPPGASPLPAWWGPWLIVAAAMALRSLLQWGMPWVPGMNGAYYLVQARALLDHGSLAIPDLPLVFALQAGLARILQLVSGGSQDACIMAAVKLVDVVAPAMLALPVAALVAAWAQGAACRRWLPLAAAAAVVLGAPAISMVGDFQKNSLAMLWLATFIWSLDAWAAGQRRWQALIAVGMLGLGAVTHIGVFGAMLVLGGAFATLQAWWGPRDELRRWWGWLLGAGLVTGLAVALVLWGFDPHRVQRLASAFTDPAGFFHWGGQGSPLAPSAAPVGAAAPMGPGDGPPAFALLRWALCLVGCGTAAGVALILARRREASPARSRAAVGACAATVAALTGPWVTGDVVPRFGLIAALPLTLAIAWMVLQLPWPRWRLALAIAALVAVVAPAVVDAGHGGRAILSDEAFAELRSLAGRIARPERTLVVAHHGLEWWTSWMLRTHISQPGAVRVGDWTTYEQVWFLKEKRGFGPGPLPFPGAGPAGQPPPADGPSGRRPPGGGRDPFSGPDIPPGADIVHDGPCFTLARVLAPPADLGAAPFR